MHCTVSEAKRRMGCHEFLDWIAYRDIQAEEQKKLMDEAERKAKAAHKAQQSTAKGNRY